MNGFRQGVPGGGDNYGEDSDALGLVLGYEWWREAACISGTETTGRSSECAGVY